MEAPSLLLIFHRKPIQCFRPVPMESAQDEKCKLAHRPIYHDIDDYCKSTENTHRYHNRNNAVQYAIDVGWFAIIETHITDANDFM